VSKAMDDALYGMKDAKEQILMFLTSRLMNPNTKKSNLGLIGPPGVGKTALARLIATVLEYPFEQISLGGIRNSETLKGHDYTYIGSRPGEIAKSISRLKYKNGIIFFDEFDKVSENKDVCSALLHITDPSQNMEFRDTYLNDITIDLSNIWYIFSMNSIPEDPALSDRIFYVDVPGYTYDEKIHIIHKHVFPKANVNIGIGAQDIVPDKFCAGFIVDFANGSSEMGVRSIERVVNDIVNKINFLCTHQDENGVMQGFNISFDVKEKMTFPFTLDVETTRKLITKKSTNTSLNMLYI
jgi:ATP-dependent Lon protease